jgi:hypothetical protein
VTASQSSIDRILAEIDSGIDVTQIDERLALTPTERLDRMRQFLVFLDEIKAENGDRLPAVSRTPGRS